MTWLFLAGLGVVVAAIVKGMVSPAVKAGVIRRQVGMRKPGTEIGSWQGCFIAGTDFNGNVTATYFENGMDYIGHPTWQEVESTLKQLANEGYLPMTPADMKLTGGCSA